MMDLLRSVGRSLRFLLGRRLGLFVGIDAVVVVYSLVAMLLSPEGNTIEIYRYLFLYPSVLLALPALAGMVDLERRAGCLDLALSTPAAEAYFVRRAGAVCVLVAIQGTLLVLVGWLYGERSFPLLPPLVQIAVTSGFLGAVSLFWAVRLRTSGGVWLASAVTVGLMSRWFFFDPTIRIFGAAHRPFLPDGEEAMPWLGSAAVLALGATLFYLYARRRLRRPERMLS
ncbi:MAG TPA: hypothetical protein VGH73_19900 [Thermoanaerobaculia bacterium]|jgi:hypothetical protein